MNAEFILLVIATLAFVGGQFLLSSSSVRGALVGIMGEKLFRSAYSILMIAALVWMVRSYNDAPYERLWDVSIDGPPVILILMYFASVFFVCRISTKNPTLAGMDGLHHDVASGKGIYAVVRHPMLTAFAFWAAVHLLVRGDVAGLIFLVDC